MENTSLLRFFLDAKVLYSILHLQERLKLSKVNGKCIFSDMAVLCLHILNCENLTYTEIPQAYIQNSRKVKREIRINAL